MSLKWKVLLPSRFLYHFPLSPLALHSAWSGVAGFALCRGDPKYVFADIKIAKFRIFNLSPVSTCKFAAVLKFENVEDLNPTQWFF